MKFTLPIILAAVGLSAMTAMPAQTASATSVTPQHGDPHCVSRSGGFSPNFAVECKNAPYDLRFQGIGVCDDHGVETYARTDWNFVEAGDNLTVFGHCENNARVKYVIIVAHRYEN